MIGVIGVMGAGALDSVDGPVGDGWQPARAATDTVAAIAAARARNVSEAIAVRISYPF